MTTVSTAEAVQALPELIELGEPVAIRDDKGNLSMLVSLRPGPISEEDRKARWAKFLTTCDQISAELQQSLAKDGITVDEFLKDALQD